MDCPETQAKLRDLILLAKEQGHLTREEIHEAMPDYKPVEIEAFIERLRNMEIEIIETAPVGGSKEGGADDEEEKPEPTLEILDDPVQMYLKQMGKVALLTREQEIEISKRIEEAGLNVQKHINRFGFIARRISISRTSLWKVVSVSTA